MSAGHQKDLLQFRPEGIFCPPAGVYLDPHRKVDRALISHAHSDHARVGCNSYLCSMECEAPLRLRLGPRAQIETIPFGRTVRINGVEFSFHPAGHVIGSAQIRVECKGEVWVYSGDYKVEDDGISGVFEPVKCHTFITETTFALPVYEWKPQHEIFREINSWWKTNASEGVYSVLSGYSLGKAQRIIKNVDAGIGRIYTHPSITQMNEVFVQAGVKLPEFTGLSGGKKKAEPEPGSLILLPPAADVSQWIGGDLPVESAFASGWMSIRGSRRRSSSARGFALSDHADWPGLNEAVKLSGASRVIATHGYKQVFARWLQENGIEAEASKTDYFSTDETSDQ